MEVYKQFFETTEDVDRILQNLILASGQKIVPEKTFIIFDEVQDCPKVINSMKYFCENAPQYLKQIDNLEPIPDAFFNPLYKKWKMYYVTGGMPEVVHMWTEARDLSAMQEALSGIIGAYERNSAKYPSLSEFPKISVIWKSVPSQLAREDKKFIYKVVREGTRAREYEDALDARLVHKVYRSTAPGPEPTPHLPPASESEGRPRRSGR